MFYRAIAFLFVLVVSASLLAGPVGAAGVWEYGGKLVSRTVTETEDGILVTVTIDDGEGAFTADCAPGASEECMEVETGSSALATGTIDGGEPVIRSFHPVRSIARP